MCGITGYIGDLDALPIVSASLENLEYRGYDSAGVAVQSNDISIYKQAGEIADIELPSISNAHCAIGHTRWSTHGEPTDENAHPHTDCAGDIAVVHNGIIENYADLREALSQRGHEFSSETDTEVVPHILAELLSDSSSLLDAVERLVEKLEGSYALAVTVAGHDEIVATRQDSPLVVGHGDDGYFLASDVPAFVEHTRRVTYLENGDVVRLADDLTIRHDGVDVTRPVETVTWSHDSVEKAGYDHYMLKEIHEQPQSLRQTLSGRIDELEGSVDLEVDLSKRYLAALEDIQIVACGTSYHAGVYAKELLERFADVRVTTEIASEYEFTGGRDPERTLVVAVTQSGETADTLSALRRANAAGVRTLAVTNTVGSTVTRETDAALYIRAGPEIGVAATKTFVSQVAMLTLFSVYVGQIRYAVSPTEAGEVLSSLEALPNAIQQVLDAEDLVKGVAEKYADSESFFFIGRKLGYAVAIESALKLKEISYDHAEGFAAGELKHGPLALVSSDTPVLAVLTEGTAPEKTLNNVKEVSSRQAPVIGVTSDSGHGAFLDETVGVPACGVLEPLVANVYFQLFAYHVAALKDRRIDKPRNLAKSVTVE